MGYGASSAAGMYEDALSLRSLPLHPAVQGRVDGDMFAAAGREQQQPNPSSSAVSVAPLRLIDPFNVKF